MIELPMYVWHFFTYCTLGNFFYSLLMSVCMFVENNIDCRYGPSCTITYNIHQYISVVSEMAIKLGIYVT